jgi:hypothetical protein
MEMKRLILIHKYLLLVLLLISGCASSKKKVVFDVIRHADGVVEFKRNRADFHDSYGPDVRVCGYGVPPLWR